jgi:hypothetical protein
MFLLFTSAGDRSILLNKIWDLYPNPLFDIMVCFYGDNETNKNILKEKSKYFYERKGGKFQNLVWIYQNYKNILEKYKYIFVLDDDIIINTLEINFCFLFANYFQTSILQPSFKNVKECRIDHLITKQVKHLFARKVNFIEVNTPLFNSHDLFLFLDYLINLKERILAGWGLESMYIHFLSSIKNKDFYILDSISCINPLIEDDEREITKLQKSDDRRKEWEALSQKYNIPNISCKDYRIYNGLTKCPEPLFIHYISTLNIDHFKIDKPLNWNLIYFNQKIKYYGENLTEKFSYFVDKLTVKNIITYICGNKIKTANVIKILKDIDDINLDDLKENYILKSSHASGWNLKLDNQIDIFKIKFNLKNWNKIYSLEKEKQYSYLKPRFFIEEIIDDKYLGKNGNAYIYMIRCIYGKPLCINIKLNDKQNYYTIDWKPFYENELGYFDKPKNLSLMLEIASILTRPFEFVRLDFHIDKNDDIYFSEYTFTPNGGNKVFSNQLEYTLGKEWI